MTDTTKALGKILWAIDPFDGWPRQIQPLGEVLRTMTGGRDCAIHPVSFFSTEEAGWFQFSSGSPVDASVFRTSLDRALGELRLHGLRETRLFVDKRVTPGSFTSMLLEMAVNERADAIAISTHGRTGLERLSRGSFAERLLRLSPVPVLVLNPIQRSERKLQSVLVPSDFTPASRAAFETAVAIAAERKVPVILLHENEKYDGEAVDAACLWVQWARERGVTVEVKLEARALGKADAIVQNAKEQNVGLIAMATRSGPLRAALGGSIARSVVRKADCPVLVWNPRRVTRIVPPAGQSVRS